MNRVDAHRLTFHGDGDGPVVVLAHGIGGRRGHWDPVIERLGHRCTVATYALAGSPEADPALFSPTRHSSMVGFADDAALLLNEAGLRGAVYVGHSLSGTAGVLASAGDPGLFGALITINGAARFQDDPATGYVGGFTADAVRDFIDAMALDYWAWAAGFAPVAMGNVDRPELAQEFVLALREYQADVAVAMFRASLDGDYRDVLPRVRVPTLVMQSADDAVVPTATAEWFAAQVPGARFQPLEATGHLPHVAAPEEVAQAIDAFLDEVG